MDTDKTTTKISLNNKQSTSSDSNDDIDEYCSINAHLEFKKHLEQLKVKVQMINDKPSTKELLYGYFPTPIVTLIFWWLY